MRKLQEIRGRGHFTVDLSTTDHQSVSRGANEIAGAFGGLSGYLGGLADQAARREGSKAGTQAGLDARLPPGTEAPITSGLVKRIIGAESSGRATAKNPKSSATGAGQFVEGTWLDMIRRHRPDLAKGKSRGEILALRLDKGLSTEMTARYVTEIKSSLKAGGVPVTDGTAYLGYFLGPGGAKALLKADPKEGAADVLARLVGPKEAAEMVEANRSVLFGKSAGEVIAWANRKMGKAGAALPSPTAAALSTRPDGPPLVLTGGGTIRGDAFDSSAIRTYGWRLEADIDRRIAQAYDAHSGSPADLRAAIVGIRNEILSDPVFRDDPTLREAMEKSITHRSTIYERKAAETHRINVRRSERSAFEETYEGARAEIEKTAFMAGADEESGAALDARVAAGIASIDAAIEGGAVTAAEGERKKRVLIESAGFARVGGVYRALPDAAARLKYAEGLLADWGKGKGPLAGLDFARVSRLTDSLKIRAERELRTGSLVSAADRGIWRRRLADDVASIEATGEPLEIDGEELDAAMVREMLGENEAERWLSRRAIAKRVYAALGEIETMTPKEMGERLESLKPKPGSAGFAEAQKLYSAAAARVNAQLKLRKTDPAAAVDRAFPDIEPLREALAGGDPSAYAALSRRRLDAQAALGIAVSDRLPLTKAEAGALIASIDAAGPEGGAGVVFALAKALGGDTDRLFGQIDDDAPGLGLAADFAAKSGDPTALRFLMIARAANRDDNAKAPKREREREATVVDAILGSALRRHPGIESEVIENAWLIARGMFRSGEIADLEVTGKGYARALEMAAGAVWRGGKKYGGTAKFNGTKVIVPPDVEAEAFEDLIEGITDEDLARMPEIFSGIPGLKVTASQIHRATLHTVQPGKYWVSLGAGRSGHPRYLADKDGKLWVLDLETVMAKGAGE